MPAIIDLNAVCDASVELGEEGVDGFLAARHP